MLKVQQKYRLLEVIGQGSFGKVYRTVDSHGKVLAVKILDVEKGNIPEVLNEIALLRELSHKNILRILSADTVDTSVWVGTEYCGGGSLHKLLRRQKCFKEIHASYIVYQIAQALAHMHQHKIIHRDLKPGNIFLDQLGNIKLGDFGVSVKLTNTSPGRETMIGTPFWMAPEVIQQDYYGISADIWAVGIIAIELVSGRTPYTGMNPMKAMSAIAHEAPPRLNSVVKGQEKALSRNYLSIVSQCVLRDPQVRITASDLCNLRFLRRYDRPDREFQRMVTDLIASMPQQSSSVAMPHPKHTNFHGKRWDFEEPPQIPSPLSTTNKPLSRSPVNMSKQRGSTGRPASPQPSNIYMLYIDFSLRLLSIRALRSELMICIEKLRLQLLQLEKSLNGFGKALIEEAFWLFEDQENTEDILNVALFKVQARSIKPTVKEKLRVAGLNLMQIEREFPGMSKALSEELCGRFVHFPYQP